MSNYGSMQFTVRLPLYSNPMMYLIHKFVVDKQTKRTYNVFPITNLKGMPTSVKRYKYNTVLIPKEGMTLFDLPHRMQKPLMRRFFNFTNSEWDDFCDEMAKALPSEQMFNMLVAPEEGCYSSIISIIQKVLMCMRTLDLYVDSEEGITIENTMLVPSFSMFQAALNVKARTLKRTPVELIPTYGYIEAERYATLKSAGKIALAMYMPEIYPYQRYKNETGRFRTTIDGHPVEAAFAGAIHDVYHAMREMAMSENVAKARMRLASIAKNHPNNKRNASSRAVDDILVDGELIYSYLPSIDTMFNPEYRPNIAEKFGDIFYTSSVLPALHDNLKRAFIEDMVVNETLWLNEFNISKSDLREQDQKIFDEIKAQKARAANVVSFSAARAMSQMGVLAANSASMTSAAASADSAPKPYL